MKRATGRVAGSQETAAAPAAGNPRAGAQAWRRSAGRSAHLDARPEEGPAPRGSRPKPCPSAARPLGGWKPEASEEEPTLSFSADGEAQGRSPAAPHLRAASAPRQCGAMGTPRRGPPVLPGPPLGRLLLPLLLSGLAPARASPRLLDHPAPVCSQEVRPRRAARMPRGRERAGCSGPGSLRWGSQRVRGSATKSGHAQEESRSGGSCGVDRRAEGIFGENDPTRRPGPEAGAPPPGPHGSG